MDSAWIAVIGTLSGVVVTSASGIVAGWLTMRGQRHNPDRQRTHEIAEHRRAERRETFVEYEIKSPDTPGRFIPQLMLGLDRESGV
jgi:hypothetical protein